MSHTAGQQQIENPEEIVPGWVKEGLPRGWGSFPLEYFYKVKGKDEYREEMSPEVSGLVSRPECRDQALYEAVVREAVT